MEIKKGVEISTDDFWYDLFEGGYIKPEDILVNDGYIKVVKEAILILKEFRSALDENDIINYL